MAAIRGTRVGTTGVLAVMLLAVLALATAAVDAEDTGRRHARGSSTLYLTYDDGASGLTPRLLDILDKYPGVRVTFFVNCREALPGTFQRILDSGHAIANHTCSHTRLTRLSGSQIRTELRKLESYVDARVRHDVRFESYRPPYGATNRSVRAAAAEAGYREWLWSVDTNDWMTPGVDRIVASLESLRNGDVALMHDSDGKGQTLEATAIFLSRHAGDHRFAVLSDTFTAPEPEVWEGRFRDDDGSRFEADIEWIAARGITRGCNPPTNTDFCPEPSVARAEMATFLVRAFGLGSSHRDAFSDDTGSVHERSINTLAAVGITRGCNPPSDSRFCPSRGVTRGEMAAFLTRALDLPVTESDSFADDHTSKFEDAINRLAAAGITRGCNPPTNSDFCPDDPVTRGQMAALLRRALER